MMVSDVAESPAVLQSDNHHDDAPARVLPSSRVELKLIPSRVKPSRQGWGIFSRPAIAAITVVIMLLGFAWLSRDSLQFGSMLRSDPRVANPDTAAVPLDVSTEELRVYFGGLALRLSNTIIEDGTPDVRSSLQKIYTSARADTKRILDHYETRCVIDGPKWRRFGAAASDGDSAIVLTARPVNPLSSAPCIGIDIQGGSTLLSANERLPWEDRACLLVLGVISVPEQGGKAINIDNIPQPSSGKLTPASVNLSR